MQTGKPVLNQLIKWSGFSSKKEIWAVYSKSPFYGADGSIIGTLSFVENVDDRVRAEEALRTSSKRLRNLSRRLIAVEESERRKINRELHDRVGASLSALNLNLSILRSQLSRESLRAVGARLEDTQRLLEETTTHVRDLMADLHPPALDDYGLLAALRTYVESLGARIAVPISIRGEPLVPRLPLAAETALFRVAQGALINAVAHAQAKRIEVLLAASPDRVTLTIADDGVGFDVTHASLAHASWGLAIMRERAEAVGAELTVESAPGKGTRICVEISRENG
jgi:two-component system sensor histidine kinase UhpB